MIPSQISGTNSAKIADTTSGLFLDKITFGAHVSAFETSAIYTKNLIPAVYTSLDTCSDFGKTI
jgi:hypothetical protein